MIFLRLFPGSPNWFMNISFPHLGISTQTFAASVFIGLLPWNYMTCSAGKMISDYSKGQKLINTNQYLVLVFMALIFLILPLIKNKLIMNR